MKTPLAALILISFFITSIIGPAPQVQAGEFRLPAPGVMVHLSPPLDPPMLKGIKVHPEDPFRFDFILDVGDASKPSLKQEASKLIKYFLASLTIPEKDLWVNLSPYEKDRIIPQSFGLTEMGRDLLAEDYMLKQITASLIYPEDEIGKKFWKRIYEEAAKRYGTTDVPVNTFNKVWIVPQKAVVYENAKASTAYVVTSKLKVMLEQDYLSLGKHVGAGSKPASTDVNQIGSQIIREIVIPELTTEVNENKNFAHLRQVYNSLILATWYKKRIIDSIFSQVYSDKNKVAGINIDDPQEKQKIYARYLRAFKKGVFNYIKEETDALSQETIPRKYFSGGLSLTWKDWAMVTIDKLPNSAVLANDHAMVIDVRISSFSDESNQTDRGISRRAALKVLAGAFALAFDPNEAFGQISQRMQTPDIRKYFGYFSKYSNPNTGLSVSHMGDPDPYKRYGTQTYDESLRSIGSGEEELKIIQTYARNNSTANTENSPQTVDRNYDPPNGVLNNIRIKNLEESNWWNTWEFKVNAGDNSWIGNAALHNYLNSHDPNLLRFAQERADFLISLQDVDGALRFGPKGQYHESGNRSFFWNIKSTENNEGALYFLDNLFTVTKNQKYRQAANQIYGWLMREMYDVDKNIFARGSVFKQGTWQKDSSAYFATDTTNWSPLERMMEDKNFGVTQLERLRRIDAMIQETERLTGVYSEGKLKGLSFSPQSAQRKVISIEWSSQLALRYWRIAQAYSSLKSQAGNTANKEELARKAEEYTLKYEGLIKELGKYFKNLEGFLVAPYAVYVNGDLAANEPTGHGWLTPAGNASIASIYYAFALAKFDPLRIDSAMSAVSLERSKKASAIDKISYINIGLMVGALFSNLYVNGIGLSAIKTPFDSLVIYSFINMITSGIASVLIPNSRKAANEEPMALPLYTNTHTPINKNRYPSLTIHIPVYNEDFETIRTTIESSLQEVNNFRETNPKVNLVISDDALNYFGHNDIARTEREALSKTPGNRSEEEQRLLERMAYYRHLEQIKAPVTIIARPAPVQGINYTQRKGLFKKGSNMNHALTGLYVNINMLMSEGKSYEEAKKATLALPQYSMTWVMGAPIKFYDVTLILDKDSIVPTGVSQRALTEFVHHSDLSYVQMATVPSNMEENYFSTVMGYATKIIFRLSMRISTIMGGMVPIVGHNVYVKTDSLIKNGGWAENRVSEDFSFAINQVAEKGVGAGKYVEYPDMLFQEAVSSTINQEMSKYQRYAFGVLEMMFNNPNEWFKKGVFNKEFRNFMTSPNISFGVKASLLSWFITVISFGIIFFHTLVSFLQPVSALTSLFPILTLSMVGNTAAAFSGVMRNDDGYTSTWSVIKNIGKSLVYGTIFVGVIPYSVFRGLFSFFYSNKPTFLPTSVGTIKSKSINQALKGINKETYLYTIAVMAIAGAQLWLVAPSIKDFLHLSFILSFAPLLQMITLPYIFDMVLMYSIWNKIKSVKLFPKISKKWLFWIPFLAASIWIESSQHQPQRFFNGNPQTQAFSIPGQNNQTFLGDQIHEYSDQLSANVDNPTWRVFTVDLPENVKDLTRYQSVYIQMRGQGNFVVQVIDGKRKNKRGADNEKYGLSDVYTVGTNGWAVIDLRNILKNQPDLNLRDGVRVVVITGRNAGLKPINRKDEIRVEQLDFSTGRPAQYTASVPLALHAAQMEEISRGDGGKSVEFAKFAKQASGEKFHSEFAALPTAVLSERLRILESLVGKLDSPSTEDRDQSYHVLSAELFNQAENTNARRYIYNVLKEHHLPINEDILEDDIARGTRVTKLLLINAPYFSWNSKEKKDYHEYTDWDGQPVTTRRYTTNDGIVYGVEGAVINKYTVQRLVDAKMLQDWAYWARIAGRELKVDIDPLVVFAIGYSETQLGITSGDNILEVHDQDQIGPQQSMVREQLLARYSRPGEDSRRAAVALNTILFAQQKLSIFSALNRVQGTNDGEVVAQVLQRYNGVGRNPLLGYKDMSEEPVIGRRSAEALKMFAGGRLTQIVNDVDAEIGYKVRQHDWGKLNTTKFNPSKTVAPKPASPSSVHRGGIDLTPQLMNLQTQHTAEGIKFHVDPAMLEQLQNASGFVGVIINIQPLKSLKEFLGSNQGSAVRFNEPLP